ncbi:MAG: methylmalonyl Co-A mutase-associated GTPase MeaB [Desulfobacterales bacterium]|nr:MAG: methylmalonyl Co-A mutase-associated GTPase MeaB [Desulfobacterales bacterium]
MKSDVDKILQGNQLAAARLIRLLEDGDPEGIQGLKAIYPYTGNALILGITGPPGAGKSTLLTHVITEFRKRNLRVGVVAVDPSSPISGGALLGDRLRMRQHTEDKGVFIRSMATRGHLGGLSKTTNETVLVLDAMGSDVIVIETVGVGQDEVDVAEAVHTTAVVSLPGMGDEIQAMKAGLLEIADIFVVNKADKPGVDDVVDQLRLMLDMRNEPDNQWKPPILKTIAVNGEGVTELVDAFMAHRSYLVESGNFDKCNVEREFQFFRNLVMEMAAGKIFDAMADLPAYNDLLANLKARKVDPYTAAETLTKGIECKI